MECLKIKSKFAITGNYQWQLVEDLKWFLYGFLLAAQIICLIKQSRGLMFSNYCVSGLLFSLIGMQSCQ